MLTGSYGWLRIKPDACGGLWNAMSALGDWRARRMPLDDWQRFWWATGWTEGL